MESFMLLILIPCTRRWWLLHTCWRMRDGLRQCITTMKLLDGLLLRILLLLFLLYICYLRGYLLLFFCAILEGILRRNTRIKRMLKNLLLLPAHLIVLLSTWRTNHKKFRINNRVMWNQWLLIKKYLYFSIETPMYFRCLEHVITPVSSTKW